MKTQLRGQSQSKVANCSRRCKTYLPRKKVLYNFSSHISSRKHLLQNFVLSKDFPIDLLAEKQYMAFFPPQFNSYKYSFNTTIIIIIILAKIN